MCNEPIQDDAELRPHVSDDGRDQALLHHMLDEAPSFPWSIEEFVREVGDRVDVEDAVCRLVGAGLVHRAGQFVWPTRTARRAQEIGLGGI